MMRDLNAPKPLEIPLILVVYLNEPLGAFIGRPAAAALVVDAFMGSHHKYLKTSLTLIGRDGKLMTIHFPGERFLQECEALCFLANAFRRHAHKNEDLTEVLRKEKHHLGIRQLLVLHADSTAPPLESVTI